MSDLSPLSERVEAPRQLALPIHPDIAVWRPATADDVDAIHALQAAADAVDHPHWTTPREDIAEQFGHSYTDPVHDSLVGLTDADRIVAWGFNVMPPAPETVARVILFGTTHPEVRGAGLGRQLLQWQRGRAAQQLAASDLPLPGWILQYLPADNESGIRLGELLGFRRARYFANLVRTLADPIADVPEDPAVRMLPWTDELADAVLAARNDAFRDHWGSQPTSAEQWRQTVGGPFFRADLSWLAVDAANPQTVVAFVVASVFEHDFASHGHPHAYVGLVGTRRAWRGRALAPALLTRTLRSAAAAGLEQVVLDVDTENPSGAVKLYADLGFVPDDRREVAMLLSY